MKIINADCIEAMKAMPENSVDSIVTDPPYGLEFMGKEWDKGVPGMQFWAEMLKVLKPGGHLLSFGGSRTYHRMASAIEDAGFEIRDQIMWIYGSGFPKSLNIGKQVDKINGKKTEEFIALGKYLKESRGETPQNQISKFFPSKTGRLTGCVSNWELGMNVPTKEQWIILKRELKLDDKFDYIIEREGAEREIIKSKRHGGGSSDIFPERNNKYDSIGKSEWEGWGTALKPAHEPIVVARKPLSERTVALNVLKWGTAGLNIDASRIVTEEIKDKKHQGTGMGYHGGKGAMRHFGSGTSHSQGRFPANIILDEAAGQMLDAQSGIIKKGGFQRGSKLTTSGKTDTRAYGVFKGGITAEPRTELDNYGASRFFYCAKASKSERGASNNHPTVKPIKLMEYLIRLITPRGGTVLDPFTGSGTTLIAAKRLNFKYIGIEKEEEYVKIAEARLKAVVVQMRLEG